MMHGYALVLWLHHEMEMNQCQFWQSNFTILSKKPGYLIFRFDVRAPMDPTVVLSNIGADALELAAKIKIHSLEIKTSAASNLSVLCHHHIDKIG